MLNILKYVPNTSTFGRMVANGENITKKFPG